MPDSKKHDHLKNLIDRLNESAVLDVQAIVFRPIDPPEPDPKTGDKFDRIAYVFGTGPSEYMGTYKHLSNCTWVQ